MHLFQDRYQAGARLAEALAPHRGDRDAVVIGLTRGGVPVAAQVARALELPLEIVVVRKLGVPGEEELSLGAIASGGGRVLNPEVIRERAIDDAEISAVEAAEREELSSREARLRPGRPPLDVRGKTVLLVDDGLATGATMRAAIRSMELAGAAQIVAAVPVASVETCRLIASEADECVCLTMPPDLWAVGQAYANFDQTSDAEVVRCLDSAARLLAPDSI